MDIKDLTDKDLMKLKQEAQETRNGYLLKRIKEELNRRKGNE